MEGPAALRRVALYLGALLLGAAAMFFLDQRQGEQRRKAVASAATAIARALAASRHPEQAQSPDQGLLDRVYHKLRTTLQEPDALTVTAHLGRVFVSGPVNRSEAVVLEHRLRELDGVTSLHLSLVELQRPQDSASEGRRIWEQRYRC